jgi:hypothetical protein
MDGTERRGVLASSRCGPIIGVIQLPLKVGDSPLKVEEFSYTKPVEVAQTPNAKHSERLVPGL